MMNHLFKKTLLTITLLLPFAVLAQDETMRTLLGNGKDLDNGGWGAPTAAYTRIMDQDAMLVGGRGGWLIDHRFTLGLAGHGLVTKVENQAYVDHYTENGISTRSDARFQAGYGGLLLEPIIAYASPIHVSFPLIIGAGGCGYSYSGPPRPSEDFDNYYMDDASAFFVLESGVDLEVNVIPMVRLALGASYRYTSDIDLPDTPTDALHGFNLGFSVKVGSF